MPQQKKSQVFNLICKTSFEYWQTSENTDMRCIRMTTDIASYMLTLIIKEV